MQWMKNVLEPFLPIWQMKGKFEKNEITHAVFLNILCMRFVVLIWIEGARDDML